MAPCIDRKVFYNLSYGLYILTSVDGEKANGQIINTAIQVTSEPVRVAVIVNKVNFTHEYIMKSGIFGVSVLGIETPMVFIGLFGFRSGRNTDKLSRTAFKTGVTGCPLVTDYGLSVLEAKVDEHMDVGSHTIFIGSVVNSEVIREGNPLTYQYYHQTLKGKSPPSAPTFEPLAQARTSRGVGH